MSFRFLPTAYKLVKFAEAKRRNDITNIAQETGYSNSMVSKTLSGLRNNELIVNKAYRIVKDRQTNLTALAKA
jgi:DNA transposition AAA+ family ATPase